MKVKHYLLISILFVSLFAIFPLKANAVTGVTVSTIATDNANKYHIWVGTAHFFNANFSLLDDIPFQWRILKDKNDRYWVFYPRNVSNSIHWSYRYSNDSITWSSASDINVAFNAAAYTQGLIMNYTALNIWYSNEGTDGLIYAIINYWKPVGISNNNCDSEFAQGTISGLTIAWTLTSTSTGTVCLRDTGTAGVPSWGGGISKDIGKNSTAISGFQNAPPTKTLYYIEASNDGWNTIKSNIQEDTTVLSDHYGGANILPITNNEFIMVVQNITRIFTRVSSSNSINPLGSWGTLQNWGYIDNIKTGFAAISENTHNFIYLTYINGSNLYFRNGTVNTTTKSITFTSPELIESSVSNTAPAIYYMNTTGNLYIFYSKNNNIYVSQFEASTNTWHAKIAVVLGTDYNIVSTKTFNTGINLNNNKVLLMFRTTENNNGTLRLASFDNILTNITATTFEGKLCGEITETNHNVTSIPKLNSIMCIGDFQTGAIINRTGFVIHNYTNPFMSAWATLSIYMGSDSAQISNEHPLKLVWQKTYEVKNNTNNRVVEYYPNLFVPDHNFVAVAFSSTEDIGMNTTVNPNTQYIVNQYAPTTVSFLQSTTKKAMFYAYWYRQNVTFAGDNSFAVQDSAFIAIPSSIQNFWISVGMPPQAGGFIILIAGIIMLAIVVLTKGVDEPEKVIGILGITAILCASAVNLIPVEIGIAVMIFVAAYFAMKIYSRMAGGSGE